jgi:hypothetical protein
MVSASAAIRSRRAGGELGVAALAAGETELPGFRGGAMVVVDRLIHARRQAGEFSAHRRAFPGCVRVSLSQLVA